MFARFFKRQAAQEEVECSICKVLTKEIRKCDGCGKNKKCKKENKNSCVVCEEEARKFRRENMAFFEYSDYGFAGGKFEDYYKDRMPNHKENIGGE